MHDEDLHGLCLNKKKCSIIVIRAKSKTSTVYLGDDPEKDKVKLLGLWIDRRYDFDVHLNHVIQSCTFKLACLMRVSSWLEQKNLKELVELF